MKIAEFELNNHKLEFYNSYWGTEQVFLDKKEISKRWTIFGSTHHIDLENETYLIKSLMTLESKGIGVSVSLSKNNDFINKQSNVVMKWRDIILTLILVFLITAVKDFLF